MRIKAPAIFAVVGGWECGVRFGGVLLSEDVVSSLNERANNCDFWVPSCLSSLTLISRLRGASSCLLRRPSRPG